MKRAICVLVFGLVFALGSTAIQAASIPLPVNGAASGIELCPQFICGVAAFTGLFHGQIGNNHNALGVLTVVLNHDPLPTLDHKYTAPITRGIWQLQTLTGQFSGAIFGGGITLADTSPTSDGKLFHVVILFVMSDGTTLFFDGYLDHHPLIPTVTGAFKSF